MISSLESNFSSAPEVFSPLSICIVSHNAYGAMRGAKAGFIGGVEWQTSLFARYLAQRGHTVTMLTWDEGGPREEILDGVRLIKLCRPNSGLPGLRFVYPKWTSLIAGLRRANADVYYHNCSECVTGQVALWCKRNGRAFVFSLASNADCDPALPELHSNRERVLYRAGLRQATCRIAQTETQARRLRQAWDLTSEVIPMPCPRPRYIAPRTAATKTPHILWVGRIAPVKRLEWFLDLAQHLPTFTFDLVGPIGNDEYGTRIRNRAQTLANVILHGRATKEQLSDYYNRATFLCCTSAYEGFPNTFLEAWSHGVPVVTTFDPDDVVQNQALGLARATVRSLAENVAGLLEPATYQATSARCRQYYESTHTPELVWPRFEAALAAAAERACPTRLALAR